MNNKTFISILLLLIIAPASQAQFGKNLINKIKNRAEQKAEQRVVNHADKAMEEAMDEAEGKNKKPAAPASEAKQDTKTASAPSQGITAFSKFDFIPGEKIIYAEDFSQDAIGELPLNWNTSGKAAVVTLEGFAGNWMKLYQNSIYLTSNKKVFPKDFTIEFDMILQFNYKEYTLPLVTVGFLASGELETTDNQLLTSPSKFHSAQLQLRPYNNGSSSASFRSYVETSEHFKSGDQNLSNLEKYYNKVAHIAMQVQKNRLRIWINSEKVFDMPQALNTKYDFNQLFFKIHTSGYLEDQIGFYIGNLKVAEGLPDARHKLIDEGSFSTNGILFDQGSAVIKPESYGIIKEVANVLKEHADVKIKITGHTSSEGKDATNLELSHKRAAAVKEALVTTYGIEASRVTTDGKGETEPVADNATKEGRLLNRRVAFTKL
ncbi:MAG TPA: OmpA family protein [Chitinophagaceae bacterium]|nr:OmpA family protein [Chitinophagaceae bacterium]